MLGLGVNHDLLVVLLIDDDMVSREVVATLLTLNGYTVHSAGDGAAALAMLDAGECVPQVILMDAQMPGLSGLELLQQLRTRFRGYIYAVSGSDGADEVIAAADGFLMKPFSPEALQKLLDGRVLCRSRSILEPAEPVLSAATLAQFREIMPEARVREVYAAITADLRKRSILLETAIAQRDADTVRRIGHAIKGGCGMAGARQIARLGALLERESDQLDNSPSVLRDLHDATQSLERMLEVEFPAQAM